MTNPRRELVSLMRGAFACPVISFLGRRGFAEPLLNGGLSLEGRVAQAELAAILRYLVALGLIEEPRPLHFLATKLGGKVLRRFGAFCLLDSYDSYFRDLDWIWPASDLPRPEVNRERNVIGSGQLHARKFFPAILRHVANRSYGHLTDLGCGDGSFLREALSVSPGLAVTAVDLSETAIRLVRQDLAARRPAVRHSAVVCNALDVSEWAQAVPAPEGTRQLITMWFVLHEVFDGTVANLAAFFREIHRRFPAAEVAFGELVRLPPEWMSRGRHESIMPEYALFHALSGQRLLSEGELASLLEQIPYRVADRQVFDPVASGAESAPSSLVCLLEPRASALQR